MKKFLLILFLFPWILIGQTKTTKGVQIVVAVNSEKQEIAALYMLSTIKKDKRALEDCANCSYFLGELIGEYQQLGVELNPRVGATVTVFKEQEVFAEKTTFPTDRFQSKNEVIMAKTKATVVENKKGELVLKTKNNEN